VRRIIGTEARNFRDWVIRKYTKSHGRLAKCEKSGHSEDLGRSQRGPTLKNYITPAGLQRLKDEHLFLLRRERPAVVEVVAWAASNGDRSENADYLYGKRRLGQIDSRIRFLTKRIGRCRGHRSRRSAAGVSRYTRLLRRNRDIQGRPPASSTSSRS